MSKRCPSCGSSVVRRSHFRNRAERELYSFQSPYRCKACGNRFLAVSDRARLAVPIWISVAVLIVFVTLNWLMAPPEVQRLAKLPSLTESSNLPKSRAESSGDKAPTLEEMAKESRCTSQPISVTGDTYKCDTRSGLTAYFVVPVAEPTIPAHIRPQESPTGTLERRGSPPL